MGKADAREVVIRVEELAKRYRLGVIGSGTLQGDIQSWIARFRKKEDPNRKIGQKQYDKAEEFWALDGINLDIYRGETIGIIGGNGAGKSTLLKILSRVTAPTKGTVAVKGRIASMLEVGTGFHRELTGRENVYLNGAIMGMSDQEVEEKLEDIVAFAEIGAFIDTPVKRYSSGMYVKLAFSVAAHLNADILIMDEVLAVGDAQFQKKCIEKMRQLATEEGKTVLFVSHNMNTISSMCSRCVVLNKGKIQFVGDTEEAIALYYQHNYGMDCIFNDLTEKERPRHQVFPMKMDWVQLQNTETTEFTAGEQIVCCLRWKSAQDVEDVCVRITLHVNGTPIGTCVSQTVAEGVRKDGVYETVISLQTELLAVGHYTASIGLYRHTEEGMHTPLDYVRDAFSFRITEGRIQNLRWNHRFLGSVVMEEAVLVRHDEIG